MKHLFLITCIVCSCAFAKAESHTTTFFQQFTSHQVKEGETASSIAKKYGVEVKDIYKFNPDAKLRVYKGLVLIIPNTNTGGGTTAGPLEGDDPSQAQEQEDLIFRSYKVKRKETLASIAQKFKLPVSVIKKYNTTLYSKPLRKGMRLQLPTNYKIPQVEVVNKDPLPKDQKNGVEIVEKVTPDTDPTDAKPKKVAPIFDRLMTYVAKPKETKFGIAKQFGISVSQLESLNPSIVSGLKIGDTLKVPFRKKITETTVRVEEVEKMVPQTYDVVKGDTMYSLLKKYGITADELLDLNPSLADGLKAGMTLNVPPKKEMVKVEVPVTIERYELPDSGVQTTSEAFGSVLPLGAKVNLRDSIFDASPKRLALMMPFGLSTLNIDPDATARDLIKSNGVTRIALDFHSGVLLALDFAKEAGITSSLDVYDTDYLKADGTATNARKVENIILSNDFKNVDAVIGPLLGANVNRAASILALNNIPVISPITSNVELRSNVFQSRPSTNALRDAMLAYVKKHGKDKKILIIADSKAKTTVNRITSLYPEAIIIEPRTADNGLYLNPDDITKHFPEVVDGVVEEPSTDTYWVFLESNDVPLISTATTDLNALKNYNDITLFTTHKGSAFNSDEIQHTHLSNLHFHYPSIDKPYSEVTNNAFTSAYLDRYGIPPNGYATRGFDIAYDTLLRLAYKGSLIDAAKEDLETDQIENKFYYSKKPFGGYQNQGVYLMKYGDNLSLEEVVPPVITEMQEETKPKE